MLTRRDLFIKWSAYGLTSLALTFLFALTLRDVELLGAHMFFPPLLVAVVASLEDPRSGVSFGLVCGVLCDLTTAGTFPCVYTLAFTLAALLGAALAQSVLQPGALCSAAVTLLTFLILDALNMLALFITARAPLGAMASLALREALISCPLLLIVHPVLRHVHDRFTL